MISSGYGAKGKPCLPGLTGKLLSLETGVTQPPDEQLGRGGREPGVLRSPAAVRCRQSPAHASGCDVEVGAFYLARALALPGNCWEQEEK